MASEVDRAFDAVRSGDVKLLTDLLAENPSLASSKGENGVSLLLTACYHRRREIVEVLLSIAGPSDIFEAAATQDGTELGTSLLEKDPAVAGAFSADGFTPLHLAAYFGREAMAGMLLDRGADPNAVSRNTMSLRPLHSAAASGSLGIVKRLLECKADVNARQHGGWTPLHAAALSGDLAMTECFLAHGADASLKSDDGKTPLDMAVEKGHGGVVECLKSRMVPGEQ